MRLTLEERSVIKSAITSRFTTVSRILLFGSRADDTLKGGDIDLFVETEDPLPEAFVHKLEAISDMQLRLGDRKIDLVLGKPESVPDDRPIARAAREKGVPL